MKIEETDHMGRSVRLHCMEIDVTFTGTEDHHRRCQSLGGDKYAKRNISVVDGVLHDWWHKRFGTLNAIQIANELNLAPELPVGRHVVCVFINGHPVQKMGKPGSNDPEVQRLAWEALFGDCKDYQEALDRINNVWSDPSYRYYLR